MIHLPETTIEEVKELTKNNCHTDSRLLIASMLPCTHLKDEYDKIRQAQERHGHLPYEQYLDRQRLDAMLWKAIKTNFTNAKEIIKAF